MWNDSKGYGFIETNGQDHFAHYTDIQMEGFKTLKEGGIIVFDSYEDSKGYIAKNIRREE